MPANFHSLTRRQLKAAGLEYASLPPEFRAFVASVEAAYQSFDADRQMMERSLELSSQELITTNEDMRALFQAMPDLLLRIGLNSKIVTVKAGTATDPAHPAYELLNKYIKEVLPPPVAAQYEKALVEALQFSRAVSIEYSLNPAQGQNFYEARFLPQPDHQVVVIVRNITVRKRAESELAHLNQRMAETQRQAGMAEVATGVLHNVGNVLNSVNVSALLLRENLAKSKLQGFFKATEMLGEHAADSVQFLTEDPKGRMLPSYLVKLGTHLAAEHQGWQAELEALGRNIEHIKEIVAMQQDYARLSGVLESLDVRDLVEDALRINESALGRHGINLIRQYDNVPHVCVDKHKVLQILINLVQNAKRALDQGDPPQKTLMISISTTPSGLVGVAVRDNGIGIPPENITRVFSHGFTTRKDGHGFGLHSGANAAKEMGGRLSAWSDGPGRGATLTLELPVAPEGTCPVTKKLQTIEYGTPEI